MSAVGLSPVPVLHEAPPTMSVEKNHSNRACTVFVWHGWMQVLWCISFLFCFLVHAVGEPSFSAAC